MPYLCPTCRSPLRQDEWQCGAGHRVEVLDGVVRLISPELAQQLADFLPALQDYREQIGRRLLDPKAYPELPFGAAVKGDREWEQRQYDLAAVVALVGQHWPEGAQAQRQKQNGERKWLHARLKKKRMTAENCREISFAQQIDG